MINEIKKYMNESRGLYVQNEKWNKIWMYILIK